MAIVSHSAARRRPPIQRIAYYARVLRTLAAVDFKMKYAQSAMGYVWSLAKPLAYFTVLWIVFGHFFRIATIEHFALYLIIGLVVYLFFIDAVGMALPAITAKGSLLRRLRFSPLVLPVAATTTAFMTFVINALAVVVFVAISHQTPGLRWLLIAPLVLELYVFAVALGLVVSTLFVHFRDVAQLWELAAQLMIFITPVMYPASAYPDWAREIAFANPLVQIMQDIRAIIVSGPQLTADDVYGPYGHLVPAVVLVFVFGLGVAIFWRGARTFAERV